MQLREQIIPHTTFSEKYELKQIDQFVRYKVRRFDTWKEIYHYENILIVSNKKMAYDRHFYERLKTMLEREP